MNGPENLTLFPASWAQNLVANSWVFCAKTHNYCVADEFETADMRKSEAEGDGLSLVASVELLNFNPVETGALSKSNAAAGRP